jgi:hypothetical protein
MGGLSAAMKIGGMVDGSGHPKRNPTEEKCCPRIDVFSPCSACRKIAQYSRMAGI